MTHKVLNRPVILDPVWMGSLGFSCLLDGKSSVAQWHNAKYGIYVSDIASISEICRRLQQAIVQKTIRDQQDALRDALLPAMGLSVQHTRDDWGSIQTSFVAPE